MEFRHRPLTPALNAKICGIELFASYGADVVPARGWATWTVDDDGRLAGGPSSSPMRFAGTYDRETQLVADAVDSTQGRASDLPTGTRRKTIRLKPGSSMANNDDGSA